jgi:SAM-dependent methyltransferase
MQNLTADSATAYEVHALAFLQGRDASMIGSQVVEQWARSLRSGAEVIELACGGGYPITKVLHAVGLKLWAMDSSPTLVAAFEHRFPSVPVQCARVQGFEFFGRTFDAAIAVGLMFLLPEHDQLALIDNVSKRLVPGGRFLFMAPIEVGTWRDLNTGMLCQSLGRERYETCLNAAGFRVVNTFIDKGVNHYYDAERIN